MPRRDLVIDRGAGLVTDWKDRRRDRFEVQIRLGLTVPWIRHWHRRQERLGIGMARILEDRGAWPDLDAL